MQTNQVEVLSDIDDNNRVETSVMRTRSMARNGNKRVIKELKKKVAPYRRARKMKLNKNLKFLTIKQNQFFIPQPEIETACEEKFCDCAENKRNCSDDQCINRQQSRDCPKSCPAKDCKNHRFTFPEKSDNIFEVFDTKTVKGKGVRALVDIEKGTFIAQYIGQFITREMAIERKQFYPTINIHMQYFMDADKYIIDPTVRGNRMRYLNHSCDPNCIVKKWLVPLEDTKAPRVYVETLRSIKKGEEMTFNYGKSFMSNIGKCHCGADNCKNRKKNRRN